ncbi:MAG: hypothetical protein KDA85_11405, partial [Planctomycetaceae bacterium]|nr:hypothetical protein [Planctomycetaceae bacterium]
MNDVRPHDRILLVTGSSDFFSQVAQICGTLLPEFHVEQGPESPDSDAIRHSRARLVISQPGSSESPTAVDHHRFARLEDTLDASLQTSIPGISCASLISRNELILKLQRMAAQSEHGTLVEETILESDWLRVSRLECSTRTQLIPTLRNRLLEGINRFTLAPDVRQHQFCMALDECLANAFYHGNLEVPSSLKEEGLSNFTDLARKRQQQAPWMDRLVRVTEVCGVFGLWLTV